MIEKCGDRARDGSFIWVCNKPAGHTGWHAYQTPGGESKIEWKDKT